MKHAFAVMMLLCSISARAAEFLVYSADDRGPNTLRWAIEQANARVGPDYITLATNLVQLRAPLPEVIDETRFELSECVIDGSMAGNSAGFVLRGARSEIKGGVLYGFARNAIELRGIKQSVREVEIGNDKVPVGGDGIVVWGDYAYIERVTVQHCRRGVVLAAGKWAQVYGVYAMKNREGGILVEAAASRAAVGGSPSLCNVVCYPPFPNSASENGRFGFAIYGNDTFLGFNRSGELGGNHGPGYIIAGVNTDMYYNTAIRNDGVGFELLERTDISRATGGCNAAGLVRSRGILAPQILSAISTAAASTTTASITGAPRRKYTVSFVFSTKNCALSYWNPTRVVETDDRGAAQTVLVANNGYRWSSFASKPIDATHVEAYVTDVDRGESSSSSIPLPIVFTAGAGTDLELTAFTTALRAAPLDRIKFHVVLHNRGPESVESRSFNIELSSNVRDTRIWPCYVEHCFSPPLASGESFEFDFIAIVSSGENATFRIRVEPWVEEATIDTDPSNDAALVTVGIDPYRKRAVRR